MYEVCPYTGTITNKQTGRPLAGQLNPEGYEHYTIFGHKVSGHRLAWLDFYGVWPTTIIDHRDEDKSNNAIWNLREATHSQNHHNVSGLHKSNRSGHRGVGLHKASGLWRARIRIDGKKVDLGYFSDPAEGEAVYLAKKKELAGL